MMKGGRAVKSKAGEEEKHKQNQVEMLSRLKRFTCPPQFHLDGILWVFLAAFFAKSN